MHSQVSGSGYRYPLHWLWHSQLQVYGLSHWYLLQYTPVQLKAGVGMGEGENVVEVDGMNVGDGVGVTARVSSTRSVGSTSGCTYSNE